MWGLRSFPHFRFGQSFSQEFYRRHPEDLRQALNRARLYVFLAPFNSLIPLQIGAEQSGHLFLRQTVLLSEFPQTLRDEFDQEHVEGSFAFDA